MKTILEIEPAYESALRAAGLADFDAMMVVQGGEPVGWHRHRETLPLDIPIDGRPKKFYLKRVFKAPPKHAFWPLLRGRIGRSQPRREWHMLGELGAAGIPVMRRVAFGERRRLGMPVSGFLLVEAVEVPWTLENWLVPGFPRPPAIDKHLRDRLFYELGMLLGELWQAGFGSPDLHAKHIFAAPLIEADGRRRWWFRLIDVERMTRPRHQAGVRVRHDRRVMPALEPVFQLVRSLSPLVLDRWSALRLLAGANLTNGFQQTGRRPENRISPEQTSLLLTPLVAGGFIRLPDDYEHPRRIAMKRYGDIVVDERFLSWLRRAGLSSIDEVFSFRIGADLTKPGLAAYRDRARIEVSDESGSKVFYLKRYRGPPLGEQLRRIREFRAKGSSAAREMHFSKRLWETGVANMHRVAYGQQMKGPIELRSFAITEEVRGESLEKLAQRAAGDPSTALAPADRREIIRQLAIIASRLHKNGLFHRDFYLSHVFLARNADGGIVLHVIDLARMIERRPPARRWQVKDLAALNYSAPAGLITRADRVRFLYDYLHEGDAFRESELSLRAKLRYAARDLIRRVRSRSRRMARHDARRAERLQGEART